MVVWLEIMTSSKLKKVLDQTAHRPYPLPKKPWTLRVRRLELLFMYYPVSNDWLRPLARPMLEVDSFDGSMWLSIMPFLMRRTRSRFLPAILWLSSFPELNVCTYVTAEGKPAIWFSSLEASTPIATRLARATYTLAYFDAKIFCRTFRDKVQYKSVRSHNGSASARLAASHGPLSEPLYRLRTLENVLTKRYCLYSVDNKERIRRSDIHHRIYSP